MDTRLTEANTNVTKEIRRKVKPHKILLWLTAIIETLGDGIDVLVNLGTRIIMFVHGVSAGVLLIGGVVRYLRRSALLVAAQKRALVNYQEQIVLLVILQSRWLIRLLDPEELVQLQYGAMRVLRRHQMTRREVYRIFKEEFDLACDILGELNVLERTACDFLTEEYIAAQEQQHGLCYET